MLADDRRILKLAVPALGALAVEPLYVLTDTAIVGRLGTPQLAGVAVAASLLTVVVAGANFLTDGTTERVARRLGAHDKAGAAAVGVQAMWLSILIGLAVAPVLGLMARPLCRAFGASGEILEHATTYLAISAVGIPFVLVTLAAQGVLRGGSEYLQPLWVLLAANVANVGLEVLFVFVFDFGIAGSAWSTVICQAGAAVVFAGLVRHRLAGSPNRWPSAAAMAPLVSAGRHLVMRGGSMLAVIAGATAIAARIDEPTLAAHQVAWSLFGLLALTLDALAVPVQTLVAEELGRGDEVAAARLARASVRLSAIAGVVLAGLLAVSAPVLPRLFTSDPAVIDRATSALWWLAATTLPGAIAFAYDGVLIGAGDYRFMGRAAFVYLLATAPFAVITLLFPSFGIAGIWAGILWWMFLRARTNHRHVLGLLPI